jgi:epoxyqueuosine reductase
MPHSPQLPSSPSVLAQRAGLIKGWAQELGFMRCGISRAEFLEEEAPRLESWLTRNLNGRMGYMANHFDKRLDPRKLVPGARSVVSLLLNYYPPAEVRQRIDAPQVSKYAYGRDYHFVIKDKLFALLNRIREEIGAVDGRAFVDSAPVMDKAWAKKAGLGWMGRNTNLITPGTGSFYFIAELILDLDLDADAAELPDYCGTCTRCLDACPTNALETPYEVDATRCISYLTIELRDRMPPEFTEQLAGWAFGCDICQDVCPWNRFSRPHTEAAFLPHPMLPDLPPADWQEISHEVFTELFRDSAVQRAGIEKLRDSVRSLGWRESD